MVENAEPKCSCWAYFIIILYSTAIQFPCLFLQRRQRIQHTNRCIRVFAFAHRHRHIQQMSLTQTIRRERTEKKERERMLHLAAPYTHTHTQPQKKSASIESTELYDHISIHSGGGNIQTSTSTLLNDHHLFWCVGVRDRNHKIVNFMKLALV